MSAVKFGRVIALLAFIALLGNGPFARGEEIAAVSGRIVLDGKPLSSGRIFFHQKDGQFFGARIDNEEGKFKVDRLPVGKYSVTIEFQGLPAKYSSADQSALTAEVQGGMNVFDFDLRSK